ncbi:tRNA modification GTPase trmE [Faunimonas pinastri]|uniref:tRNA modification GTPase MnmE n=1 Tax=Faunimonas pinastri TaxID=1855383 RepID=A0A1H9GW45_9HYPH|nr:tRNA uridine-5-carboxymethylaminomethyl(34) synthesis GTPase MnmE [Faunimonas pinastri]SEQ54264.1 tRNA modification GTPase trmE [Faunimonas pinastri]
MDTIYALSSGGLPSGVAIIRISGPRTREILTATCGSLAEPRHAALVPFRNLGNGEELDRGLCLWFPGPASFTGEDCGELHVHGSRAVVQALFASLSGAGCRPAEAGEFTRRAFANGKLDLTEVEGLADLLAAETEMQRRQAAQQASGALSRLCLAWRERLIGLRAEVEARLDFSDEDDVGGETLPLGFVDELRRLTDEVKRALAAGSTAERIRNGVRVALLGRPNVGKSTLLNALAARDVAIVSEEAGTTRDVIEVPLDLRGYPVIVFDTAGIRETSSAVEQEGIARGRRVAANSDLVLWLVDGDDDDPAPELGEVPCWRLQTKGDLKAKTAPSDISISAASGQGMSELLDRIEEFARSVSPPTNEAVFVRERQRRVLADLSETLQLCVAGSQRSDEVLAHLLRQATDCIGRLTGRVDVEAVLDRLFMEFCIGK